MALETDVLKSTVVTGTAPLTVASGTVVANLNASKLEGNAASAFEPAITTLSVAKGGTGQTSYTDGQLLIGNSTGNTLSKATITAGNGISITNGSGSITITNTGTEGREFVNAYFVDKGGLDSKDGKSIAEAKLTFANAYTAIFNQTPSTSNRFTLNCFDSGIYSTDTVLDSDPYVDTFAPTATFNCRFVLDDEQHWDIGDITVTGSHTILIDKSSGGTGNTHFKFKKLDARGLTSNSIGARTQTGTFLSLEFDEFYPFAGSVTIGNTISTVGYISVSGGTIFLSNGCTAFATPNSACEIEGYCNIDEVSGGATTSVGFNLVNGSISMRGDRVIADTLISSTAGTIKLNYNEAAGTTTIASGVSAYLTIGKYTSGNITVAGTLYLSGEYVGGNITVQNGGVLYLGSNYVAGNITVDIGGKLYTNVNQYAGSITNNAYIFGKIGNLDFSHPSKNYLIAADFEYAPFSRGTAFTSTTSIPNSDGKYLADRWMLISNGNDIVDVALDSGTNDRLLLDVETANAKFGIIQPLLAEDCVELLDYYGDSNWYANLAVRMSTSKTANMKMAILVWDGAANLCTHPIAAWNAADVDPTLTSNWHYIATADISSTTAATTFHLPAARLNDVAGRVQVAVMIWHNKTAQLNVGDIVRINNVKLGKGKYFDGWAIPNKTEILNRCATFYNQTYNLRTMPGSATNVGRLDCNKAPVATTLISLNWFYGAKMWKIPTITAYSSVSGLSGRFYNLDTGTDVTVATGDQSIDHTIFAVSVAVTPEYRYIGHATAEAELCI